MASIPLKGGGALIVPSMNDRSVALAKTKREDKLKAMKNEFKSIATRVKTMESLAATITEKQHEHKTMPTHISVAFKGVTDTLYSLNRNFLNASQQVQDDAATKIAALIRGFLARTRYRRARGAMRTWHRMETSSVCEYMAKWMSVRLKNYRLLEDIRRKESLRTARVVIHAWDSLAKRNRADRMAIRAKEQAVLAKHVRLVAGRIFRAWKAEALGPHSRKRVKANSLARQRQAEEELLSRALPDEEITVEMVQLVMENSAIQSLRTKTSKRVLSEAFTAWYELATSSEVHKIYQAHTKAKVHAEHRMLRTVLRTWGVWAKDHAKGVGRGRFHARRNKLVEIEREHFTLKHRVFTEWRSFAHRSGEVQRRFRRVQQRLCMSVLQEWRAAAHRSHELRVVAVERWLAAGTLQRQVIFRAWYLYVHDRKTKKNIQSLIVNMYQRRRSREILYKAFRAWKRVVTATVRGSDLQEVNEQLELENALLKQNEEAATGLTEELRGSLTAMTQSFREADNKLTAKDEELLKNKMALHAATAELQRIHNLLEHLPAIKHLVSLKTLTVPGQEQSSVGAANDIKNPLEESSGKLKLRRFGSKPSMSPLPSSPSLSDGDSGNQSVSVSRDPVEDETLRRVKEVASLWKVPRKYVPPATGGTEADVEIRRLERVAAFLFTGDRDALAFSETDTPTVHLTAEIQKKYPAKLHAYVQTLVRELADVETQTVLGGGVRASSQSTLQLDESQRSSTRLEASHGSQGSVEGRAGSAGGVGGAGADSMHTTDDRDGPRRDQNRARRKRDGKQDLRHMGGAAKHGFRGYDEILAQMLANGESRPHLNTDDGLSLFVNKIEAPTVPAGESRDPRMTGPSSRALSYLNSPRLAGAGGVAEEFTTVKSLRRDPSLTTLQPSQPRRSATTQERARAAAASRSLRRSPDESRSPSPGGASGDAGEARAGVNRLQPPAGARQSANPGPYPGEGGRSPVDRARTPTSDSDTQTPPASREREQSASDGSRRRAAGSVPPPRAQGGRDGTRGKSPPTNFSVNARPVSPLNHSPAPDKDLSTLTPMTKGLTKQKSTTLTPAVATQLSTQPSQVRRVIDKRTSTSSPGAPQPQPRSTSASGQLEGSGESSDDDKLFASADSMPRGFGKERAEGPLRQEQWVEALSRLDGSSSRVSNVARQSSTNVPVSGIVASASLSTPTFPSLAPFVSPFGIASVGGGPAAQRPSAVATETEQEAAWTGFFSHTRSLVVPKKQEMRRFDSETSPNRRQRLDQPDTLAAFRAFTPSPVLKKKSRRYL